jgi:hypothetical protein
MRKNRRTLPSRQRTYIRLQARSPRGCNQSFLQCHKRIAQARFDAGEEVKAFSQKMSRLIELFWRVIEFLAQMPTDTMIFLTLAVLGLATTLIVLRWLI